MQMILTGHNNLSFHVMSIVEQSPPDESRLAVITSNHRVAAVLVSYPLDHLVGSTQLNDTRNRLTTENRVHHK